MMPARDSEGKKLIVTERDHRIALIKNTFSNPVYGPVLESCPERFA